MLMLVMVDLSEGTGQMLYGPGMRIYSKRGRSVWAFELTPPLAVPQLP